MKRLATLLAKAASSGSVRCAVPITVAPPSTDARIATARAMRTGSSSNAAIAQPMVSMIRRLQSWTTSAGRSAKASRVANSAMLLVLWSICRL